MVQAGTCRLPVEAGTSFAFTVKAVGGLWFHIYINHMMHMQHLTWSFHAIGYLHICTCAENEVVYDVCRLQAHLLDVLGWVQQQMEGLRQQQVVQEVARAHAPGLARGQQVMPADLHHQTTSWHPSLQTNQGDLVSVGQPSTVPEHSAVNSQLQELEELHKRLQDSYRRVRYNSSTTAS